MRFLKAPDLKPTQPCYSWKRDPLIWTYSALLFVPIIMVFLAFNTYQNNFCVYSGRALLVFSIVIILLAGYEFRVRGGAPKGESVVHTTVLVDSGVYAVIRHPQYFGFIIFVLSLVLMSQHWVSIFSGILGSSLFYIDVLREEQMSIVKFGDEYKHYMNKVPRMNFILGIIRLIKRGNSRVQ